MGMWLQLLCGSFNPPQSTEYCSLHETALWPWGTILPLAHFLNTQNGEELYLDLEIAGHAHYAHPQIILKERY